MLSGTGYRRERKGSPLANSWRQYADAFAWPALMVQNGSGGDPPRPDVVVVDISTLRDSLRYRETRDACELLAAPLGATLTSDDISAAEQDEARVDGAIWTLQPVTLEFTCVDRPSAKALAEAFSGALCGAAPTALRSKKRAGHERVAAEDDAGDA